MNNRWMNNRTPMTLIELSGVVGIKYITLHRAVREGRIEAHRSGATWLSTPAAVAKAIKAGKIRTGG